jgi:hypothetical protein
VALEKANRILMKSSPSYSEKWLQEQLIVDPSILNLGDIFLKDKERRQISGGRLDMLFEDVDGNTRYEVELQLGSTDETHIIRTIEYWDIERKRYPNYEHVAVIVAEDITTRFFNVISLFNGQIPIIAIQINLLDVGGKLTLHASTILDLMPRVEEEETEVQTVGREYWNQRVGNLMNSVDDLFKMTCEVDSNLELTYRIGYCGLSRNGVADNYLIFKPRRNFISLQIKLPQTQEVTKSLEDVGLTSNYNNHWRRYIIHLKPEDIKNNKEFIKKLIKTTKEQSSRHEN